MSEQQNQNKLTIRRMYEEALNQGRLEGLKQRISMIRSAFNPQFTIEHMVAEGDKVAVMWSNVGTHVGEGFGFSPSGKSITTRGVDIHLLRDGRLAEHWDVVDTSTFLLAVGAVAVPGGTAGARA